MKHIKNGLLIAAILFLALDAVFIDGNVWETIGFFALGFLLRFVWDTLKS